MDKVKIRFLETCIVDDENKGTPKEVKFKQGKIFTMSDASGSRWVRRGKAEYVGTKNAPADKAAASEGGQPGADAAAAAAKAQQESGNDDPEDGNGNGNDDDENGNGDGNGQETGETGSGNDPDKSAAVSAGFTVKQGTVGWNVLRPDGSKVNTVGMKRKKAERLAAEENEKAAAAAKTAEGTGGPERSEVMGGTGGRT